jgi:hypothetical protein
VDQSVGRGESSIFLGIDPGREKCGLALVTVNLDVLGLEVCPTDRLIERVSGLLQSNPDASILLGDGTGHRELKPALTEAFPDVPLLVVSERGTTEEARILYFSDHPPRGLMRLVPRGLLTPGKLLDAYAAKAIVFRHIKITKKAGNGV